MLHAEMMQTIVTLQLDQEKHDMTIMTKVDGRTMQAVRRCFAAP